MINKYTNKEIRDFISCPQFGDNKYGKWGSLNLNVRETIYNLLKLNEDYDKLIYQLQSNWNSLREIIEAEKTRLAKECSHTYEDSLGKTKYVNEDIFNELDKILDKMNELEGRDK